MQLSLLVSEVRDLPLDRWSLVAPTREGTGGTMYAKGCLLARYLQMFEYKSKIGPECTCSWITLG